MDCEGCGGKCCIFLGVVTPNPQTDSYHKLRGAKVINKMAYYEIPCSLFDEKTGKCKDYENRPISCKNFPVGSTKCLEISKLKLGVDI